MKTTQAYCNLISAAARRSWATTVTKSAAAIFLMGWTAASLAAQPLAGERLSISPTALTARSYTVDLENRYANVGAAIVVALPNDFGVPAGILAFGSGTLIHPRVFLTAGHFTGPGAFPLPPFIKVYVAFGANVLNPSNWIPVSAQVTHPSLPPCPPPVGCDPTTTDAFTAGDPRFTDLGLIFLAQAVENIKPADLAPPGRLEKKQTEPVPMTTVGYGFPAPLPGGGPPDNSQWDGLRKYRSSKLAQILNGQWASWELPGSVCFGDSGSPTFLDLLPEVPQNHQTIVAVASDGGIDCLSKDIRVRVDTHAVDQWIKDTIKQQLGAKAVLETTRVE
jgi:hypothetical protein